MKRQLPIIIIFILGVFMVFQYHIPHETSEFFYEFIALDWPPIIGMFALTLGIISLVRVSITRVRQRQENWPYSLVTLAALGTILIGGFIAGGPDSTFVRRQFDNMIIPVSATMFSLLAFFIASAAYRAFRARSALATILLTAAILVMVRFFAIELLVPIYFLMLVGIVVVTVMFFRTGNVLLGSLLTLVTLAMLAFWYYGFPAAPVARWILTVPNLAAKRAVIIGVGLGIVSTALKVILGVERSFLGRD